MQYQQFLLGIGNQASSLGLIVRWGLTNVVTLWPKVVELHLQQTAGNAALQILDQLATGGGPRSANDSNPASPYHSASGDTERSRGAGRPTGRCPNSQLWNPRFGAVDHPVGEAQRLCLDILGDSYGRRRCLRSRRVQ
jgi:hypothetical protein